MKTSKNQNNLRTSLKTSTPISENVESNFLPPLKSMNVIKPNNQKKKSVNSYYDFLKVKKGSKATGFNSSTDYESGKENSTIPLSSALNKFAKSTSRRSKTSAFKRLNALKDSNKITDISPICSESWCGKRYRSSQQSCNFDLKKDVIRLNKTENQNSRNSENIDLYSQIPVGSFIRVSSPFLSARNNLEVKKINRKESDVSVNSDVILKNNYITGNKRSVLTKNTSGAIPRLSNSSIGKKVRFSDRIELFGDINVNHKNFNSGNASIKGGKTGLDAYVFKELLELLEDKNTFAKEKEPKISTTVPQQITRASMNDASSIEASKNCIEKNTIKDGGGVNKRGKMCKVRRTQLKKSRRNFGKDNDIINDKTRNNHQSRKKKRVQYIVDEEESLDWDIDVSASLTVGHNPKSSSPTENKEMNMEFNEANHLSKEDVLYADILNGTEENKKNDSIYTEHFMNNNKHQKDRKMVNGKNFLICRTEGPFIEEESKQKKRKTVSEDLESLEETVLYPSTSTPFDSPQRENKSLSFNIERLSPILENQAEIVSDAFYDYEPSVMFTERTYGKCKLKSISKEEKLWSLITTTSSPVQIGQNPHI